jgi:hypothetical protein
LLETPIRLETVHRIIAFQKIWSQAARSKSALAYLLSAGALFGLFRRCYAAFIALPPATQAVIDPDGTFGFIRAQVLAYVQDELIAHEMNPFDAALARWHWRISAPKPRHLRRRCTALFKPRRRRQALPVQGL